MRFPLAFLLVAALVAPASAPAIIVGGDETQKTWPFMGYIETAREELELGDNQFCGASLIAPTWALTAAHCVTVDPLVDPLATTFVIGRHSKSDTSSGERIQIKRMLRHESYDTPPSANDVMLLELDRAPAAAQPVKIAGAAEEALWAPGASATILGWGAVTEGGSGSDTLKEARVPLVSDPDCEKAYPGQIDQATMVCAGYPAGGTDTCQGDSGGPMVVPAADGSWRLAGATSWGDGCARPEKFGVYTRVAGAKLRAWVAAVVPEAISVAPAPAPAATSASSGAGSGAPASQPAPAQSAPANKNGSPKRSTAAKRAAAKRAAVRKRACVRAAKRIKSSKRRARALRACARKRGR